MLRVDRLSVRYGTHAAVDSVSFEVLPGQWWVIAGPNGAGKTSLVNAVSGGASCSGSVLLDGVPARDYAPGAFARRVGVLSQVHPAVYGFTVGEVVEMGRYAHRRGFLRGRDPEGGGKVAQALALTGLTGLKDRSMLSVSGGEAQRAFLAQVLAQDPKLLILDEPANHLDLPFQQELFSLVSEWLKTPGRAVITVLHDLSLARLYGTRALLLKEGRPVAQGPAGQVLTREDLRQVYGMDVFAWMQDMLAGWQE